MLLGKRPRPPMKRTTSMTEFTLDLSTTTTIINNNGDAVPVANYQQRFDPHNPFINSSNDMNGCLDQRFMAAATAASPRIHRRNSADFVETASFLRACHLCKRRLIPGRDIYMYRGDSAFCSLECRQQQMNQDERKEKRCSQLASKTEAAAAAATAGAAGPPEVSTKAETVTAV